MAIKIIAILSSAFLLRALLDLSFIWFGGAFDGETVVETTLFRVVSVMVEFFWAFPLSLTVTMDALFGTFSFWLKGMQMVNITTKI